jgi:hypothetical protein
MHSRQASLQLLVRGAQCCRLPGSTMLLLLLEVFVK